MSVIKVELINGVAYILDEWGNIWQLICNDPNLPELRRVTRLDLDTRDRIMEPQLERFIR